MPKQIRTTYTIDHWTFRRIFTRKGLHNHREDGEFRPNAWFASLRESVWADLEERGSLSYLEIDEILSWADAHHARTGDWPAHNSGPIPEAPGETWLAVEAALTYGLRGLAGGWTLLRLLAVHRGVYNPRDPHFTIPQILAWADAWHLQTGEWPIATSGEIPDSTGINWVIVDHALRRGRGGLPPGSSLSRLLMAKRSVFRNIDHFGLITEDQILAWADQWHSRTGRWPKQYSGDLPGYQGIHWGKLDDALRDGRAGLPGGSSLARLLAQRRGVYYPLDQPCLTVQQILAWADAFHHRTGAWPKRNDEDPIPGADRHETWDKIDLALRKGMRGLPGGSSLARLLTSKLGVRNKSSLAPLVENQILVWADAFYARQRHWPHQNSGRIHEAPGETWVAVDSALREGLRGLPGGSSLARLLVERRGIKCWAHRPALSIAQILSWADAHFNRTGQWPAAASGPIVDTTDETWLAVQRALTDGLRGLPGGSSIARLLAQERGVPNEKDLPPFRIPEILRWADAYHARHNKWPKPSSGVIPEAPHETWLKVQTALHSGLRGLPGGSTLARLLAARRGVRNLRDLAPLSEKQILAWVDAFQLRTGRRPTNRSGPIPEAPGENWQGVENALVKGMRSLPGGSSLAKFLDQHRRTRIGP